MSRAVKLTGPNGAPFRIAAEHVSAITGTPDGGCIVYIAGNSDDDHWKARESLDEASALVWPRRWQSIVDDQDMAPDVLPPDGWDAIGPWTLGGFSAVQQSASWQRSYGVIWTRPLRRVAVLS